MSIKNLLRERGRQLEALYLAGNKSIGTPSLIAVQVLILLLDLRIIQSLMSKIHSEETGIKL